MDSISDNALMLKVRDGDLDKLGLLFERYRKILFGFFYNMSHDTGLSEDLVQNVFMRILKYRAGFKGDGEFKVWMFHIARNVGHDHYRKTKGKETDEIDNWKDKLGDDNMNREVEMEKGEDLDLLRLALKRLDEEKREILTLSKLEGMKYKNIGDILNCSEGAVKVKVFRALQALKQEYMHLQARV
ncbi:RNA polymerase sigma factor [Fulvivirga kasyanovii]|uniref:RNA polymerase sigma factor n=1 Tax=Fulvivirga kasyanovii TaxID=396812 RepID=A0ABW9RWD5_9BACT|nr:RNA polymerase sigma factor [Fulvivirga kasyanovii]MTI27320.1 RNA polymerase sigma factor [Fulvivirga kasyanovii]